RDVVRPDVRGLRDCGHAAVDGRGRELNCVVPICCIAVRRIGTSTGRPVAECPRLRRETHATRVEGLVDELDNVEGRRVEGEEEEDGDRRWRDVEEELERAALAEQVVNLEA